MRPDEFEDGHYYYAGYSENSFAPSTQYKIDYIQALVNLQQETLKNFESAKHMHLVDKKVHKKVKRLIKRSLNPWFKQTSYDKLVKLDKPAIPSIILQMEDYRKLDGTFTMSPGGLHYRPEVVVDELTTILSFHTGKYLSRISNGGSARERQHAIDVWRLYLTDFK